MSYYRGGVFSGPSFMSEEDLVRRMQEAVETVNRQGWDRIDIEPTMGMTQQTLNDLHDVFERLTESPRYHSEEGQKANEALSEINVCIHSLEQVLRNPWGGMVEVNPRPVEHQRLSEEDFEHFTPDMEFGGLYLSYCHTGVPPLSAFFSQVEGKIRPQTHLSGAVFINLFEDKKFRRWDLYRDWVQKKNLGEINSPSCPTGYIKLGKIKNLHQAPEELMREIGDCRQVMSSLVREKVPAVTAPGFFRHQELSQHIQLVPYIDLQWDFNWQACWREAKAQFDKFVTHRNYDQSSEDGDTSERRAQWKSLGLRALDGDSSKTLFHTSYGYAEKEKAPYQVTEIASECPETMKLVNSITRVEGCHRIRYMLLEPGARIHVHSDAPKSDEMVAINIALNMPKGCEFWIDANPDGSHNANTRRMPMRNGSAFLVNVARYHYVENNSDEPRFHIIVHGPLSVSEGDLLRLVRQQNGVRGEKVGELLSQRQGTREFKVFASEWETLEVAWPGQESENWAIHFGGKSENASCLENWLSEFAKKSSVRYVALFKKGEDFEHDREEYVKAALLKMKKSRAGVAGFLFEQEGRSVIDHRLTVLDLSQWKESGEPSLSGGDSWGEELLKRFREVHISVLSLYQVFPSEG